jgi:hypothetical protein
MPEGIFESVLVRLHLAAIFKWPQNSCQQGGTLQSGRVLPKGRGTANPACEIVTNTVPLPRNGGVWERSSLSTQYTVNGIVSTSLSTEYQIRATSGSCLSHRKTNEFLEVSSKFSKA